jgi:hypothetical protein
MKKPETNLGNRYNMIRTLLTTSLSALAIGALTAQASPTGFDLPGDSANYIILYEGGGIHQLSINNFGTTGIWEGDIGIAGTGMLAATGPGTIDGNVNFAAANTGQAAVSNTSFTPGHGLNFNVGSVQTDMNALNSLSATFGAQAALGTVVAINTTSDQTVLASSGFLDANGNRLFTVNSVSSNNGQNLIVKGDGSHNVVFNVNTPGDAQFHGNILLQDLNGKFYGQAGYAGPTPNQVLFNLYAGAALVGGDKLDANNNGNAAHPANVIEGTFLGPNGVISFVNTRFIGHIYGGDTSNMQIVSGDTLTLPPPGNFVPDAGSSLLLMSMGLGALVMVRKKLVA